MIRSLSGELINKIAAGEVVERPSSVIKELVENSIDAHATEIFVEIDIDYLKVSDNGDGISKNDLNKLFINHSTSKIHDIDDLSHITTMGFRGEALATIGAVSHASITSKYKKHSQAYSIDNKNHETILSAHNFGTTVVIKDLFYNVPARKKFLKSDAYENRQITDFITKISIAYPEIGFKLKIKDKIVLNLQKTDLEKRLSQIITNIKLLPLIHDDTITGYISNPKDSFSKSMYQYMYVNRRLIHPSSALAKAVFAGYKNTLMRGQYPPYVIFINVKPQDVDVNVHPRKIEVRFDNEGYMFQKIYSTIQHTLFRVDSATSLRHVEKKYTEIPFTENVSTPSIPLIQQSLDFTSRILTDSLEISKLPPLNISTAHQYLQSYIVVENDKGMVVFDQHACSERFLFEKFKNASQQQEVKTKNLLIAEKVKLEYAEQMWEYKDILSTFGVLLKKIRSDIYISALPEFANLKIIDKLYMDLIDVWSSDLSSIAELQDKIITTLACHSAIRFGDILTDAECRKIIVDLTTCINPMTCPHGRPTHYVLEMSRLKDIFKR